MHRSLHYWNRVELAYIYFLHILTVFDFFSPPYIWNKVQISNQGISFSVGCTRSALKKGLCSQSLPAASHCTRLADEGCYCTSASWRCWIGFCKSSITTSVVETLASHKVEFWARNSSGILTSPSSAFLITLLHTDNVTPPERRTCLWTPAQESFCHQSQGKHANRSPRAQASFWLWVSVHTAYVFHCAFCTHAGLNSRD